MGTIFVHLNLTALRASDTEPAVADCAEQQAVGQR